MGGIIMIAKRLAIAIVSLAGMAALVVGQEKEDRTLLPQEQMTSIINEVSGERALHHVLELVPYQFVRPPSEYTGHFREAESLASTNANGDISGELVLITQDQQQDFGGKDVRGKFVLSLAPTGLGQFYNRAVAAGAIGVVGVSAIGA